MAWLRAWGRRSICRSCVGVHVHYICIYNTCTCIHEKYMRMQISTRTHVPVQTQHTFIME